MGVLFVSYHDWANLGYLLSKSLQSIGIDAKAIALYRHAFYEEQAEIVTNPCELVAQYDVIIAMHSGHVQCTLNGQRLFVFHGGSAYRQNPYELNRFFNPIVEGTILQHWEFLDKGAINPHWLLPPADLTIEPDYTYYGKRVAHYPRHPYVKGSVDVLKALAGLIYDSTTVPHEENLERMSKCDIYVEQLCPHDWGLTALEAAALGKIVITTFHGLEKYEREYGKCELVVANTGEELKERVTEILGWTEDTILEKKKATRQWVEKYHSFQAIGKRLKEILT